MYKKVLENINGVEIFPVFVLILFFVFFVFVLVWIIRLKKPFLEKMSDLPLSDVLIVNRKEKDK
ncbi:MAG: CcoQ/FixQ family Cbb3-type cytochrome c oxidase assembly chaperone [Ignavibacteria bacterium]|nr:CcoQ/FixQ family Cbb3-type cytochrome c oxidase assembly chaperone [Ignavibacteria bacterium]